MQSTDAEPALQIDAASGAIAPSILAAEAPAKHTPSGSRELLTLAAPLILSQSFMTVQVFIDTILLSWHDTDEMSASLPAMMWFWLGFGFLQVTAGYTSTFVAQYTGARRPHRVGPAVWQGIYFAIVTGALFLLVVPAAPWIVALAKHQVHLQPLETIYLQCLSYAAMPMLIIAAVNGFFSGRGQTWTVLAIDAVGTIVNVLLALVLVFGRLGMPEMGIAGAGWATVVGSWASALFALALLVRPRYQAEFATFSGWRPERELFLRLMRFGGPAGLQVLLDVIVFSIFVQVVGQLGDAAQGASTLTIRLNMIAFLPMMGLGQAITVLVGQRLGAGRPDLAEKSTYTGLAWMFGYMVVVATMYLAFPQALVSLFDSGREPEKFAAIAAIVPSLLICVAVYSVADALNLTFAFALRGAGDTWFVSWLTFCLAWPIMVVPTIVAVTLNASVYWAWGFATAHILAMAVCFFFRFRNGKWKTMRVIESTAH